MSAYEGLLDSLSKAIDKQEALQLKIDYWRTMWALECGVCSYYAYLEHPQIPDTTRAEFHEKLKTEHHEIAKRHLLQPHIEGLANAKNDVEGVFHSRYIALIEKELKP